LTAFVRAHLPLPKRSGITVRAIDGRAGVAALRDGHADLLILDAFVGARVPAEVTTVEFFCDVRRVLADTGVLLINVTDRGPLPYARRVLAGVASSFPHRLLCAEPATLRGRRFGNVILVGSVAELPVAEIAERAGRGPYPYRVLHGARIAQLLTGVYPLTEINSELSPEPPRGRSHFE
jgi:spermidine synthase